MIRLSCILLLLAGPAAQASPMLQALRQRNWPVAQALAASEPDGLAPRLVTFIRLLMPDAATADELLDFLTQNPSWPDRPVLERRFAEALAADPDEADVARLCRLHPSQLATALQPCAVAFAETGAHDAARGAARDAWIAGITDPAEEDAFLARWGKVLTPSDQRRRFDRLETTDDAAARRQVPRLDAADRGLAAARLALRRQDPDALALLPAVPEALRADPDLLLAEARFLRRSHAEAAALALWKTALPAAEAAAPAARRGAFWSERDALARRLLAAGDAHAAYALADDPGLPPDQAVDAQFLAGWIAARFLHDYTLARPHFLALSALAHAAITQARAFYWLGRIAATPAEAGADFAKAAAWPLTYYGQLAVRAESQGEAALAAQIVSRRDPPATPAENAAFDASEMARAARLLVAWEDPRRAADFLAQAAQPPATAARRALTAQLALRLGLPDVAVQTARLAGRDGEVLAESGWPVAVMPPAGPVPAPLALGLIRQESSFDAQIISPAGARGLMQLMPPTAQQIAASLHIPAGPLADPAINMRLGTAYLQGLLQKFGNVVPYAVAAYDAGPRHVQEWIAANGDAAATGDADSMTDWIEQIPFAETRNYVQRVLENRTVYAARLGASAAASARP
jgi:soluble lytic murein transglycosylase